MQNELTKATDSSGTVKLIYFLFLAGIILQITSIIGVVVAYIYRSDAPEWLQQHYRFQIRTFWISLLAGIVAFLLSFVLIGYLVYLLWLIWVIVRCVKGLKALDNREPPANPTTWLF